MALQKCRDCGYELSYSARRCPSCGAYHWTKGRIIFAILVLALFVAFIRGVLL